MRKKLKTFNLTEKRVEALRYIEKHPGVYVCGVAQEVLASRDEYWSKTPTGVRPLWNQAATRMGAGYCKVLQEQGLVTIDTHVDYGYGKVTISDKGVAKLREIDAQNNSLDAVLARCVE